MIIVRDLPQQLILAHAPWTLGGFLIVCIVGCAAAALGLIFDGQTKGLFALAVLTAIPLILFARMVQRDQATFNAQTGRITLQRQTLWRYSCADLSLRELQRAEVETLSDTGRPVLILAGPRGPARYPLIDAHVSGNGPKTTADTINRWLNDLRSQRQNGA